MIKREVLKRVQDIIRYVEHQQTLPTGACSVVAAKKLKMLVKEAPPSLVYDLSCIHSQLLYFGDRRRYCSEPNEATPT